MKGDGGQNVRKGTFAKGDGGENVREGTFAKGDGGQNVREGMFAKGDLQGHRIHQTLPSLPSLAPPIQEGSGNQTTCTVADTQFAGTAA